VSPPGTAPARVRRASWAGTIRDVSPRLPFTAFFRVYEPVEVLGLDVAALDGRPQTDPAVGPALERDAAVRRAATAPPLIGPATETDEVLLLTREDGRQFGCPWQTRLRCWLSLEQTRDAFPDIVLDAFWAPGSVAAAEREFAKWRAINPNASAHIRSNAWQVPLSWFVVFSATERERGNNDARWLRYRTPMVDARRRLARNLTTLRRTVEDNPITDGVVDLGKWLESFHPEAVCELDYGGLVTLVDDAELDADTSAGDVQEALAALASGDGETAVERYRRLVDRWRRYAEYGHFS
jgi:hypothetical protein